MSWFLKMQIKTKVFDFQRENVFSLENWWISHEREKKCWHEKIFFSSKFLQKRFKVHFCHFEKNFRLFFAKRISLFFSKGFLWFWMNLFFLPSTWNNWRSICDTKKWERKEASMTSLGIRLFINSPLRFFSKDWLDIGRTIWNMIWIGFYFIFSIFFRRFFEISGEWTEISGLPEIFTWKLSVPLE